MVIDKEQPWFKTVRDRYNQTGDEIDLKRKRDYDPLVSINAIMKEHDKSKKKKKEEKDYKKDSKIKKNTSVEIVKKAKTIEELRAER